MPYNTIRDPGISRGFSILADAFTPNANALVQADLAAKRRDQLLVETEGQTLENTQRQNQITSTRQLQEILAGNPNMSDPALRGKVMSNLAAMEGGLQYGPGFAAGSATFVNPNFVNESDLSKILLGTGVTSTFAATPDGQARDLQNALELQQMKNDAAFDQQLLNNAGAMDRTRYQTDNGGGTGDRAPATVSPETSDELFEQARARLFQGQNDPSMDPELESAMRLRLADTYARTKNVEAAIADVLSGVPVKKEDNWQWLDPSSWAFPEWSGSQRYSLDKDAAATEGQAPAANSKGQKFPDGARTTVNGQEFVRQGGQWVPIK